MVLLLHRMTEQRRSDQEDLDRAFLSRPHFSTALNRPLYASSTEPESDHRVSSPGSMKMATSFSSFDSQGSPRLFYLSSQSPPVPGPNNSPPNHQSHHLPSSLYSSVLPPISRSLHSTPPPPPLQDLQQQINAKSTALQTLQRDHDELFERLETLTAQCASLEQRLEASDDEIGSLAEENQRLQIRASAYQSQVDELQQSREDARLQLAASSAQYMKIIEMSSRLQVQGAEEKHRWENEKRELELRIKTLEHAIISGSANSQTVLISPNSDERHMSGTGFGSGQPNSASRETISLLHAEIGRLRTKTESLETSLQIARDENQSIQLAAKQISEASSRFEEAISNSFSHPPS